MKNNENVIEFLTDQNIITITATKRGFITQIKKLAKKNPDEIQIVTKNKDGSILAKMPLSYLKLAKPVVPELTSEQRRDKKKIFAENKKRFQK